jgi:hypothetical protein
MSAASPIHPQTGADLTEIDGEPVLAYGMCRQCAFSRHFLGKLNNKH